MSRGKQAPKRAIAPDPIYNSQLLAKFINFLMLDGKKSTAQRIVYNALTIVKEKTGEEALATFEKAIDIVRPQVEVRSRRVGGANYQVPMPVQSRRQLALTFRWLIAASKTRKGKSMAQKLSDEIIDILEGVGATLKKKEDVQRMAEANKAFAHFARFRR
ncbi:MAG: 30S ribosomal protein S7 [Candidatus Magasanikbacteria bacterium]|jgi:small subunit ribosomal protein S7|nr:30S ribosomal protein S7 [Candidatus Magasanikbacteria bacterium]MBT4220758.1 30S ribosomal protein S7 [Candidatus Magasanikbacteria bacterium]MBT4350103.1 30S ribosomal protein S7 [Candidatus Magasanikbacteria bacterium]MBT4541454.1 30S ribosomal protein S7 [Candidatus Magasanikbacteria bacterium]MBT6252982.1 30S ribosomal protein S7 [Candidatus Magasanikbacteria bacterium]